jgi:phosphate starvation-inducible PhoH-like protein
MTMKRLKIDHLLNYDAITQNQKIAYDSWDDGDHLVLAGSAGTGKTFIGMYLALSDVLDKSYEQDKLVIVRSVVPTREMGYLPGSIEEKVDAYTAPYRAIATELFNEKMAYNALEAQGAISFMSTSFIRGQTIDDAIILVDEMQNLTYHELDSIITRVGRNTRIIFSGDYYQSDLNKETDKNGVLDFLNIMEVMNNFTTVEFGWADIVRSDFVRDYIMTKEMVERGKLN